MRVNAPQVAQYVEVQAGGLHRFRTALAQALQMPLGGDTLGGNLQLPRAGFSGTRQLQYNFIAYLHENHTTDRRLLRPPAAAERLCPCL